MHFARTIDLERQLSVRSRREDLIKRGVLQPPSASGEFVYSVADPPNSISSSVWLPDENSLQIII